MVSQMQLLHYSLHSFPTRRSSDLVQDVFDIVSCKVNPEHLWVIFYIVDIPVSYTHLTIFGHGDDAGLLADHNGDSVGVFRNTKTGAVAVNFAAPP